MIPDLWRVRAMPLDHCGGWSVLAFDVRDLVAIYADDAGGGAVLVLRTGGRWLTACGHKDPTTCVDYLMDAWQRGVSP